MKQELIFDIMTFLSSNSLLYKIDSQQHPTRTHGRHYNIIDPPYRHVLLRYIAATAEVYIHRIRV